MKYTDFQYQVTCHILGDEGRTDVTVLKQMSASDHIIGKMDERTLVTIQTFWMGLIWLQFSVATR